MAKLEDDQIFKVESFNEFLTLIQTIDTEVDKI